MSEVSTPKRWLGQELPNTVSIALLLLRLAFGAAMITHGYLKIQTPFHWMDAAGPSGMPGVFQFLAALSEFGGSIALILGALTRLAAFGLASTMFVAVYTHLSHGHPFSGAHAWELANIYLWVALLFLLSGAGKYSLDHWLATKFRS